MQKNFSDVGGVQSGRRLGGFTVGKILFGTDTSPPSNAGRGPRSRSHG